MGNFFSGLAQTAVKAAPYAAQVIAQREAKQKADRATALAQLRQQSQDNTASVLANVQAGVGLANIGKLNAETTKLNQPVGPKPTEYETLDTDGGFVRVPKVGQPGPIMGADGKPLQKRVTAPPPQHDQYAFPTVMGADGNPVVARANTHTGEIEPTSIGAKPTGGGARSSATITKALAENQQTLSYIDKAIAAVKTHPDAFGLGRGLPAIGGYVDQRMDPEGNEARSLVANIGSQQIHDRTGAAMSMHEEKRLSPFVPGISDTKEKILTNLQQLRDGLTQTNSALQNGGVPEGADTAPAGRGRGGPTSSTPRTPSGGGVNAEAAWAAKNPPHPGESFEAYHARYLSGGAK